MDENKWVAVSQSKLLYMREMAQDTDVYKTNASEEKYGTLFL